MAPCPRVRRSPDPRPLGNTSMGCWWLGWPGLLSVARTGRCRTQRESRDLHRAGTETSSLRSRGDSGGAQGSMQAAVTSRAHSRSLHFKPGFPSRRCLPFLSWLLGSHLPPDLGLHQPDSTAGSRELRGLCALGPATETSSGVLWQWVILHWRCQEKCCLLSSFCYILYLEPPASETPSRSVSIVVFSTWGGRRWNELGECDTHGARRELLFRSLRSTDASKPTNKPIHLQQANPNPLNQQLRPNQLSNCHAGFHSHKSCWAYGWLLRGYRCSCSHPRVWGR